ncbi:GNAT family N-acetyltransferase [Pseudactinotalea sp.]|uniref:GNAT family N-acetyltransferase n=1 Tax=Pseudactinotalea sp. TaxID=1926260 RepID=UPI003B3A92F7
MVRAGAPTWRDLKIATAPGALLVTMASSTPGQRAALGVGDAVGLSRLATRLEGGLAVITLPPQAWQAMPADDLARLGLSSRARWEWMVTHEASQVRPGEAQVREVDLAAELDALTALQRRALPHTYTSLDRPGYRWFGWYDPEGELRSMAGAGDWVHEVHLGSVATDEGWRGRGVGAALTAAVTRQGLTATGQVSLGVYTENTRAIALYERLGFTIAYSADSRRP